MDFAKKQLEKYGWREGKGLGKNEDGLSTALKPKLKFDNAGVGHNIGEQFTNNWWENVYNNALNNIEVNKNNDNVNVSLKNKDSVDITTKNNSIKHLTEDKHVEYASFIKTSTLTENGIVHIKNVPLPDVETSPNFVALNDEELFAACGGRTAHKGARHGLKLSGKLSRIEKQEKMLLKKLQNVSICDEKKHIEKKMKKIAKHKDSSRKCTDTEDGLNMVTLEDDSRSSSSSSTRKKKKKRERKSVSFSDTVTEYHTQDLDSSIHSNDSNEAPIVLTVIEKSKIKDEDVQINVNPDTNILDEGIEQDIEVRNNEDCDHKSFEEAQCSNTEKLSKAERNLKMKNRATFRFLQEVLDKPGLDEEPVMSVCDSCKKRKHLDVEESEGKLKRYHMNPESTKNKIKKMKEKKQRQKKRQEKKINSIAKSLDKICKISDRE